jgi:hypothetical protein
LRDFGVDNRHYDNDFAGIAAGAVPVSHDHEPAGAKR